MEQTLIFFHIPKSGGSTLREIIGRQYPAEAILTQDAKKPMEAIEHLQRMSAEQKARLAVVQGHSVLGVHDLLPKPSTYVTMLRDPVERVISFYYYILQSPEHYLFPRVAEGRMSLRDFIQNGVSKETDNFQCRLLSRDCGRADFGQCPPSMLDDARDNLERYFSVVGLTERFTETLVLLGEIFGWRKRLFFRKINVTKNRARREEIPAGVLDLIRGCNQLDMALYQYACERLKTQLREQHLWFWIRYGLIRAKSVLLEQAGKWK